MSTIELDSQGNEAKRIIVVDPSSVSVRNNRYRTGITATWPSDDTFSVTWTAGEAVVAYRILVEGGSTGDFVKVAEDADNEATAETWLADATNSQTADVNHIKVYTSTPDTGQNFMPLWSAWQIFPDGEALSRLDFLASASGPFTVFIEAE